MPVVLTTYEESCEVHSAQRLSCTSGREGLSSLKVPRFFSQHLAVETHPQQQ